MIFRGGDIDDSKRRSLAFFQHKLDLDAFSGVRQGNGRAQLKRELGRDESGTPTIDNYFVRIPCVAERGFALHFPVNSTSNNVHSTDDLRPIVAVWRCDRHEVDDLSDAFVGEETRNENVGFGPVELLMCRSFVYRVNAETAAFYIVEDRPEHAR